MADEKQNLILCGRRAAFKEITEGEYLAALAERDRVRHALAEQFPGILDDVNGTHRHKGEADRRYTLLGIRLPLIRVAWAGEGEPPTEAEILAETRARVLQACYALRRVNPDLEELPLAPFPN